MTPEELKQNSQEVKPEGKPIDRRGFLKLAGVTLAGVLTGTIFRSKESTEATSPPQNPYYWNDNLRRNRKNYFDNASHGIYPYNNINRPVGTSYEWVDTPDTNPPTYTYQPWEVIYPETQAGLGIDLGILGQLADASSIKKYMLTFVMASQDGELLNLSVEVMNDYNKPNDYSNAGRERMTDGLPQGIHRVGVRITSYQFVLDSSNKKKIEVGWMNEYVPIEHGLIQAYIENTNNQLHFIPVASADPTATPQPTPTVISRRSLLLPMIKNNSQEGK